MNKRSCGEYVNETTIKQQRLQEYKLGAQLNRLQNMSRYKLSTHVYKFIF